MIQNVSRPLPTVFHILISVIDLICVICVICGYYLICGSICDNLGTRPENDPVSLYRAMQGRLIFALASYADRSLRGLRMQQIR